MSNTAMPVDAPVHRKKLSPLFTNILLTVAFLYGCSLSGFGYLLKTAFFLVVGLLPADFLEFCIFKVQISLALVGLAAIVIVALVDRKNNSLESDAPGVSSAPSNSADDGRCLQPYQPSRNTNEGQTCRFLEPAGSEHGRHTNQPHGTSQRTDSGATRTSNNASILPQTAEHQSHAIFDNGPSPVARQEDHRTSNLQCQSKRLAALSLKNNAPPAGSVALCEQAFEHPISGQYSANMFPNPRTPEHPKHAISHSKNQDLGEAHQKHGLSSNHSNGNARSDRLSGSTMQQSIGFSKDEHQPGHTPDSCRSIKTETQHIEGLKDVGCQMNIQSLGVRTDSRRQTSVNEGCQAFPTVNHSQSLFHEVSLDDGGSFRHAAFSDTAVGTKGDEPSTSQPASELRPLSDCSPMELHPRASKGTMTCHFQSRDASVNTHESVCRLVRNSGTITSGPFMKKLRRAQRLQQEARERAASEMKRKLSEWRESMARYKDKLLKLTMQIEKKDQLLGFTLTNRKVSEQDAKGICNTIRYSVDKLENQKKVNQKLQDDIEAKSSVMNSIGESGSQEKF